MILESSVAILHKFLTGSLEIHLDRGSTWVTMSHSRRKGSSANNASISQDKEMVQEPPKLMEKFRNLVHQYTNEQQHGTALFWVGQLISLPESYEDKDKDFNEEEFISDQILMAEVLINNGEFRRAANRLLSRNLNQLSLKACYVTARAFHEAKEPEEAVEVLDRGITLIDNSKKKLQESQDLDEKRNLRQKLSSIYLLKGKILENLDNRKLAAESFKEALRIDVYCSEALQILIKHQILTADEEKELLESLKFEDSDSDEEVIRFLYKMRLKKYSKPSDLEVPEELKDLSQNVDVAIHKAESHFYNCDYNECHRLTASVIREDPFHTECLPIHISCLVELDHSNELFHLSHKLVDLHPEWSVAWFSVGSYYYLIGKQDFARRYLSKATQLDRVFGPAWLAYGHSFAMENEHDQAMAAYFKACQLMKGCHLPLLYIGVEYGLTNNAKLAERFFKQSLELAPEDPFVLHELGVTSFQNQNYLEAYKYLLMAIQQLMKVEGSVLSSKWEPLLNNLGHTSRKLGKLNEALEFHRRALVLVPLSASTFSAIGYVYALQGNLLEAIDTFHKALGIRRDDTFSTTMLSNVIEQMTKEEPAFPGVPDEIHKFEPLGNDFINPNDESQQQVDDTIDAEEGNSTLDVEMEEAET